MPLTPEERLELLEKARAVKASKKIERDKLKPKPVKGRPKKTLNLDDVTDQTNVEELAEDIKTMKVKEESVEEPTIKETELPQQNEEEEDNVEIVEEVVKKPKKKKKIIRRYIEPSSSEEEIVEEYIKKKPKPKPKASPRYQPYHREEPEPIKLTNPSLNLFCY